MTLVDQHERDRIAHDLDVTMIVEAAAGTGKTTALVGRILSLIKTGKAKLSGIAAVTFTESAAGEMKLRLREEIERARVDATDEVRERLERALRELEAARIATIHSLCNDLLHERPVEAGVDPRFTVAAEGDARALFEQAFEGWFQEVLSDPPEGVRRFLRRRARGKDRPRDQLRAAAWTIANQRDYARGWHRAPLDREGEIDAVVETFGRLGRHQDRATNQDDRLVKSVTAIAHWHDELRHRESVRDRDYDGLEAELLALLRPYPNHWNWRGYGASFGRVPIAEVRAERDAAKEQLDRVVDLCSRDLAPCLELALWPVVERYARVKEQAGVLDFFDLLLKTRELLAGDASVRGETQARITHVLVDEFQDTDPLQVEIMLLLAAADPTVSDAARAQVAPGKLFLVGDPKQSIYRFRRADVVLYENLKERLLLDGAVLVQLSTSFRSDPRIQDAVNRSFESRMQGDGQAHYVPLAPFREPDTTRPAFIALPVPDPYADWGGITGRAVSDSFSDAVGGFVSWLVNESGWKVVDPSTGQRVPVAARHVCLLFRRMQSWGKPVAHAYTQALEARGIPHVLVGGRAFHDREEVVALRNALSAIEWPDDELSVYATLRGPLFAVGDDALLQWRHRFGSLHPLRPRDDDGELTPLLTEVGEPLDLLARLHRRRNRRPFADTLSRLLEAARAHAGFAFWTGGEQVLGNVLRTVELARRAESVGATSFRAFVEELWSDAERGEAAEAAVVEEGTEGVRVLTVHKAKGLEFPVVVLCDPTCNAVGGRPSRWTDPETHRCFEPLAGCVPSELEAHGAEVLRRDREESDRLLYVASTRARDLLIVPAVGDAAQSVPTWWTAPLDPAVFPAPTTRHHPSPAPGCPSFGSDSVRKRPDRARPEAVAVKPGLHATGSGGEVVWWDPYQLPLDASETTGLRYDEILAEDPEGREAEDSVRRHAAWAQARSDAVEAGSRPSVRVATPTELAVEAAGGDVEGVRIETTDVGREGRPAGRRFGTLVHETLEALPLDADGDLVASTVAWRGRVLGAPSGEIGAATAAVVVAIGHPVMQEAAQSADLRREVALSYVLEDGGIVEGSADLAFKNPDDPTRWTVVDFKTSTEESSREKWVAQVGCYCEAVRRATGEAADGVVLMV
ncbi:MAG: UvrD-helicase domain-containing protein [Planctomycetes bacterium]|nr:UvrD-helicase domain-containing protein [Planctomycetota bacterium]